MSVNGLFWRKKAPGSGALERMELSLVCFAGCAAVAAGAYGAVTQDEEAFQCQLGRCDIASPTSLRTLHTSCRTVIYRRNSYSTLLSYC